MNTHKQFRIKAIVLLCTGICISSLSQANTQTEIDELKHELHMLKQLVQHMNSQQQTQSEQLVKAQKFQKSSQNQNLKNTVGLTKGGAEFNLYGNIRLDALYQIEGGTQSRLYNQINTVPLTRDSASSDILKSTLAATRLGLDFKASILNENLGGKIEVDFLGANDALRIRHAYLTYNQWLIGQTWSNFAIPDYMPESIDALGYVGGAVKRDPQIRYTQKFNPNSSLVIALEDTKDSSSHMKLPALTMHFNQKITENLNISARTMLDEKRSDNDQAMAWGVGFGLKYDVFENTTFKADYYHVKGDSSLVSWTNAGFVVDQEDHTLAMNKFNSITFGVTQQINEKMRTTLGYGYMKADPNQHYLDASLDLTKINKELWQAWANVFYSPVKPISLGLEYVYGERKAYADDVQGSNKGIDNRFNAVAIYTF
ncbi:DcaP family trimeric outer membrane transporter [Acinetobacter equi]|uniref:DcaP-like protein n=1 Tax=Acinetobacter equi TaxID=1324350 RepID=A0A0N9W0K7_9GAMM|nr:DcaP family trimeric outer membrane transporter [Acinetobacter equi]ALH96077.1 hypothetical protein AOY20_11330 [Acinetobacter equi]